MLSHFQRVSNVLEKEGKSALLLRVQFCCLISLSQQLHYSHLSDEKTEAQGN